MRRVKGACRASSRHDPALLPACELLPGAAELEQHLLGLRPGVLRGAPDDRRLARELDRVRAHAHRPLGRGRLEQVAVGLDLRVLGQVERALQRPPDALRGAQDARPLVARPGREVACQLLGDLLALLLSGGGRRVALEEVPAADRLREVRPEALRLEHHEDDRLPVPADVVPDQRVRRDAHLARRGQQDAVHEGGDDVGREHPQGRAEERDVELDALAGLLAPEERRRHAARDAHPADEVAEGGPLLHVGPAGRREPVRDPAPRPERHAVVSAAARVGPARALAVALGVDEARVHAPQVLVGDAEALARVGQEVGQEHVGALDQAVEERAAVVGPEIDADAALLPPELLDDEVAARRPGDHAARDQAADRVAVARVLDLHHLRAPVAERGAGGGDEAPVRDLDHLYAVQHGRHGRTLGGRGRRRQGHEEARTGGARRAMREGVDAWNHNNYCVPPEHVDGLSACIEALFPWTLIVRKPHLVGYRLGDDLNRGALYLRPAPAARAVFDALARLRRSDAELGRALAALEAQEADLTDHHGIRVASVEEWERRVARALALARTRPDLAVTGGGGERPGDAGAWTDYLYQAWVRLGLLGPWRNTFELQALAEGKEPMR